MFQHQINWILLYKQQVNVLHKFLNNHLNMQNNKDVCYPLQYLLKMKINLQEKNQNIIHYLIILMNNHYLIFYFFYQKVLIYIFPHILINLSSITNYTLYHQKILYKNLIFKNLYSIEFTKQDHYVFYF